jgi:hypothetical protein
MKKVLLALLVILTASIIIFAVGCDSNGPPTPIAKGPGPTTPTPTPTGTTPTPTPTGTTPTPPPAATVVFSLADWLLTNSSINYSARPLQANSGSTYTVTAAGIEVTGRNATGSNAHEGLDLWIDSANLDLDFAAKTYEITVEGTTIGAASGKMKLSGADDPWPTLKDQTVSGSNAAFTLSIEIPSSFDGQNRIRIQTEGDTGMEFKITKIELVEK